MEWILTGCALALLIGCTICAVLAFRARNEAADIEDHLRRSLGRIAALEAELDVLAKQLQKLRGKLYADKTADQEKLPIAIAETPACENWLIAQRDGPRSAAAKCECADCTRRRAEREAFRALHVPKTTQERKRAIEKGQH